MPRSSKGNNSASTKRGGKRIIDGGGSETVSGIFHPLLPLSAKTGFANRVLSGTSVWRPQSRYTVSRIECRIKFPQNQRCRAKLALNPPKSRCRTFIQTPLSHLPLVRSRQGARRAGGGYRGTFGFRKRIALQGGVAATVTPVALLCATKTVRVAEAFHKHLRELYFLSGKDRLGRLGMCWLSWSWMLLMCAAPESLSRSLGVCPWTRIFLHDPFEQMAGICCPSSLPPVQKLDAQHKLLQHKRAHTDSLATLREEHSMDRCRCRPELSERYVCESLVHMNFRGNSYGVTMDQFV